jgi:hypothetical protein
MRKLTEDFIGTCQCCLGEYKVSSAAVMTLHGYKRPGFGYVLGRCTGAGHTPFEYSCELTKKVIQSMQADATKMVKNIASIDAGKIKKVPNPSYKPEDKRDRYYDATTAEFLFPGDNLFEHRLSVIRVNIANELKYLNDTIRYYEGRVDNWTRLGIIGIDSPATGKTRIMRDAYSAEDQEKRDALDTVRAERDAKPGKLMISIFEQFSYPTSIGRDVSPEAEATWRANMDKKHQAEKAFKEAVKAVAKKRWPGKIWVGAGYGSDVESEFRRAGRPLDISHRSTEVINIKPEWHYLDEILAAFPNAIKREEKNGKEVKLFLSFNDFNA